MNIDQHPQKAIQGDKTMDDINKVLGEHTHTYNCPTQML